MIESSLWIIFIIVSGTYSQQQCTTDNPVAFMCQNSNVTGSNVTLDVSMAAAIDTDSCTCTVTAEVNGMAMVIEKYPDDASNCGSQISVFFMDKSLLTQCGPPPGPQDTNGKSADVVYTRIRNSTDSSYCITFYSGTRDFFISIACFSPANSSQETTTAPSLSSNSTPGTPFSLSPNTSIASSTATLPTNLTTSSTPQSPNSTIATTRSPFTSTSTTSDTHLTTVLKSSTSIMNTTVASVTTSSVPFTTAASASSYSSNVTSGSTTLTQNSTVSANISATSSTSPLNNKTETTTVVQLTTISTSNSPNSSSETTSLTQNSTMSANISTTPSTSPQNNKTTAESSTLDPGASTTTEMPTTTTDFLSTTVEYLTTDDPNNTEVTTARIKNTTVQNSTNSNSSSSSAGTTVTTSNSSMNSTSAPDTRTDAPNSTEFNTATTSPDSTYTTNDGTTITDVTDVTNEPDNVTAEYNTTARPTKTTRNWDWDIPDPGDYSDDNKTNAMVIVLPLVAVILVFFLGAVTFIICKRSRKASRQTRLPKNNVKTVSKDKDKSTPPTFLAPNLVNEQDKKEKERSANEGEHIGNGKLNHNKYPIISAEKQVNLKSDTVDKSDTVPVATRDKPSVYQPTEKERNLLESLELSTIVVESDPNDPNRYFKKADPGDWYRVVMKGRDPKDNKGNKKKKKKNRGEEGNKDTKKGKGKKKHKHSSGESSEERKRSRHKSDDKYVSKVARKKDYKTEDSLNAIQSVQPRVIVSQPASKQLTNHEDSSVPKTKVVMSKPSPALGEPHDTRTRTVLSKPSSETTPSANTRLSSGQVVIPKAANSGNSGQANVHSTPKEAPKQEIKRPDIVPPLNLTGTGDKVTRTDDGFDSFVLIN